jgi:hypothetical protein
MFEMSLLKEAPVPWEPKVEYQVNKHLVGRGHALAGQNPHLQRPSMVDGTRKRRVQSMHELPPDEKLARMNALGKRIDMTAEHRLLLASNLAFVGERYGTLPSLWQPSHPHSNQ